MVERTLQGSRDMPPFKLVVPLVLLLAAACISLPEIEPEMPPTITEGTQSADTVLAGVEVTFHVTAQDAKNGSLRFEWTASTGTLGSPASTGTTSDVTW